MVIYRITEILVRAFTGNEDAQIVKLHQVARGWCGILRDRKDGQEYIISCVPIPKEQYVPSTFNELMDMQKG